VLKHAGVSERAGPGLRAGDVRRGPCHCRFPFLPPALPGEEEPLLPVGHPGGDQSLREVHASPQAEEAEPADGKCRPASSPAPRGRFCLLTLALFPLPAGSWAKGFSGWWSAFSGPGSVRV
jgi:hypothetical protein